MCMSTYYRYVQKQVYLIPSLRISIKQHLLPHCGMMGKFHRQQSFHSCNGDTDIFVLHEHCANIF